MKKRTLLTPAMAELALNTNIIAGMVFVAKQRLEAIDRHSQRYSERINSGEWTEGLTEGVEDPIGILPLYSRHGQRQYFTICGGNHRLAAIKATGEPLSLVMSYLSTEEELRREYEKAIDELEEVIKILKEK